MKKGDSVILQKRGYPIGEIIKEIPKVKPSNKRLFMIKYNIIDKDNYTTTCCFIDELTLKHNE